MQKTNPLATPKHHLISGQKGVQKAQQNSLTSLLNSGKICFFPCSNSTVVVLVLVPVPVLLFVVVVVVTLPLCPDALPLSVGRGRRIYLASDKSYCMVRVMSQGVEKLKDRITPHV